MTTVLAIKQLEEKNVACEIILMVWSDRMDLVALANIKGEVSLHRLTWTKAWTLSPPKDNLRVKSIVWRPDGKIIAIAYSSSQVILVKVENKNTLHSIDIKSEIACLSWMQDRNFLKKKTLDSEESKQNQYLKFIDWSQNFLPEPVPQQFEASNEETQKTNILQEQNDLNLLLIGTSDGTVHIHIFGCFPCASLDLKNHLEGFCSIESIYLNENLDRMFVTIRDANQCVRLLIFNSDIFYSHVNELYVIALKYIKLNSLINYLSNTISTITESWESILLELDTKLSKYASKVPEGGVTADFLDLLMFGICSDEMKAFLIHDLTKKGLEKFGQTIEMSYSNIQKLLLKYVMKFAQNVTYHLVELRGMARLQHRYQILGLEESTITDSIQANGAFLIKAGEMQQIINHSIINYKAFFRWLYMAIVHVLEEQIPNEIPKMTQQDLAYITEFIQNFDRISCQNSTGFIMERLGQYLNDGPLTIESNMDANEWTQFLNQNQCIQQHPSILKHFREMSLIQQFKFLNQKIDSIFTKPKESLSGEFSLIDSFTFFQDGGDSLKVTQMNIDKNSTIFSFLQTPDKILLVHLSGGLLRLLRLYFPYENSDTNYVILDAKLYTPTVLSVLVQNKDKSTILSQVPLSHAYDLLTQGVTEINAFDLQPQFSQNVEGLIGAEFAVSGCRKVGIVLAENRRKVRLYEMEGEEEEEDDADMNSTLKEGDSVEMND